MAQTGRKPDFVVMTKRDPNDRNSGLVQIGAAWNARSRETGETYISVRLSARPWGDWDGSLQLHERTGDEYTGDQSE